MTRDVATIVTQIIVDQNDPSIKNPTKFIGPFYTGEQAEMLTEIFDWVIKNDSGKGYRRVVPSPMPLSIINHRLVQHLVDQGVIVIAAGGGGIPVYIETDGTYEGVDAVIDKDRASAVLAHDIQAQTLMILTNVENVFIDFKKPGQKKLTRVTLSEIKQYRAEGQFPAGSMGPKIEAAINFLEGGGEEVIITSMGKSAAALKGTAGTKIVH